MGVHKRSRENRSSQRVLRQRAFYVGKQTAVKNRLWALLAQQGERIRQEVERVENLFTDKGMKILRGLDLPEREAKLVGALVRTYHHIADFDIRCFYDRLKKRKGANSAKVATVRRLLTIIYRMLKENRSYIPYKR